LAARFPWFWCPPARPTYAPTCRLGVSRFQAQLLTQSDFSQGCC
jgi:hypothetical protein